MVGFIYLVLVIIVKLVAGLPFAAALVVTLVGMAAITLAARAVGAAIVPKVAPAASAATAALSRPELAGCGILAAGEQSDARPDHRWNSIGPPPSRQGVRGLGICVAPVPDNTGRIGTA